MQHWFYQFFIEGEGGGGSMAIKWVAVGVHDDIYTINAAKKMNVT